eukprot:TRINITY_DN20201_c0_g1_i1.p1 TRINITY_DN20201_c0_g1~~TRINITY_DN20201_c0_g1_i1.p1  ORF type:complete len:437 (-),score=34.23 TRINITY_DN20201_c0_g1_i1:42-1295(-)
MSFIRAGSMFFALAVAFVDAECSDFHCHDSSDCWAELFCGTCDICTGSSSRRRRSYIHRRRRSYSSPRRRSSISGGYHKREDPAFPWMITTVTALVTIVIGYFCYCRCKKKTEERAPDQERLMLDQDDVENGDDPDEREVELIKGISCPAYWSNQNLLEDFDTREVVPRHVVKRLQELLDQTFKDTATRDRQKGVRMPKRLNLIKAQRIEDSHMFLTYEKAKRDIRQNRKSACTRAETLGKGHIRRVKTMCAGDGFFDSRMDGNINEFYLWHGTSPQAAFAISEDGFRISLSGSNRGTMFGHGAYFAECSSKADEYAKGGDDLYQGIYAILLCRVVCGEMLHTTNDRDIPNIEKAIRSRTHDSVLGDREQAVGTYREFVVFREAQIYPEYVILYERLYDEGAEEDNCSNTESESESE